MNVSDTIDALGGTAETSRLFGVSMAAVSQWRASGFPARLHLRIYRECQSRGIDYDPEAPASPPAAPVDAAQPQTAE